MTTKTTGATFPKDLTSALEQWRALALIAMQAKWVARLKRCEALKTVEGKNATEREAAADVATSAEKIEAERAQLEADAAYHWMLHLRGSSDERAATPEAA